MGLLTNFERGYYNGNDFGGYQFTSLSDIINNFMATYIGEDRILPTTRRSDVTFHAMRAMQELSFDTFKSCKSQEIEVAPHLTMPLPLDYVNYVKLSWSDSSGIEHIIYPTSKTSNPRALNQDSDGDYKITAVGSLVLGSAEVVLDGFYPGIQTGMVVIGNDLFNSSTGNYKVYHTSTVGGITTITMNNNPLSTITQELSFFPQQSSTARPISNQFSAVHLSSVTWNALDHRIQAASISDAAKVTVGMIASHEDFPIGTMVVDVNGLVITLNNDSTAVSAAPDNINFVDYDGDSDTWSSFKSNTPSENNNDDYQENNYWSMNGQRYGLDPQHAQVNGSYFIDCHKGKIHFSSNLAGKTVILKYISDGLGTNEEMMVHKFAEEAMYKWIMYGCLSARIDIPEYVIRRYKKERFAETRKAKLRLSNIKLEEITQILRGKSKQIKH